MYTTLCTIFLALLSSFFTITFHSNHNPLLFLMVLYTMVCFSMKQDQLNSIIQTLEVSLPTELDQYAEELQDLHFDVDDYDSSPDTDDGPTPLSAGIICMYTLITQQQYSVSWIHTQGHSEKLIELLDQYAMMKPTIFQGLVQMMPLAFQELAKCLQQMKSFNSGQVSIKQSREILSVALYQLGKSGNGARCHRDGWPAQESAPNDQQQLW
ncbi:hypothetical protein NDA11_000593 [Ustilago hordei]|uniref:Uncharacterized protein n=1 Tax=Ustilago hordei TaxID=120017 RepID=I2FSY1_USTHO|nr:hypothetical protein NDA10_004947 [Ustilago hordei]KAJ1570521.1 hypothetical protein NDA11_000593 [Ustilago hordei]KAJ1587295.1 hypothetical protein NDA15_004163 [Ustilago hordei]KAJ1589955.1 hypothetical protein NDA12_002443 [Ustilago hordei]UTT96564.1 hypothetical protein NDA17_001433 [Ustilago hordei]